MDKKTGIDGKIEVRNKVGLTDFRVQNIIHVNDRGFYLIGDNEEDASEITKRPGISLLRFRREVVKDDRNGGRKDRRIESRNEEDVGE